jgi:hypothetical protein
MKREKPNKAKAPAKRPRAAARKNASPKKAPARVPATGKKAALRRAGTGAATAPVKSARRKVAVPPILLEGDAPSIVRPSGPGKRYDIGREEREPGEMEAMELPEAYGTQRVLLVARDPHWLYVHWDMTIEQLRQHNKQSRDGHLVVKIFRDRPGGTPIVEQHVHPESRNWFVHVGRGGTRYVAQLGYFDVDGNWQAVATSGATFTPPDLVSSDTTVRFETIPIEVPFRKLLETVKAVVSEHRPLVEALRELRAAGFPGLPKAPPGAAAPEWTPEQERALAEIVSIDEVRRVWMGSLEITELVRRSLEREISSQAAAAFARGEAAERGELSSISSPFGGAEKKKGFWFNVNAELIIYGATEPDAAVTIGGRRIELRPDGTFSFRFALPDGNYDLPVQATSAEGDDARAAGLSFRRRTDYRGEVGKHPQDARLKEPRAEHIS